MPEELKTESLQGWRLYRLGNSKVMENYKVSYQPYLHPLTRMRSIQIKKGGYLQPAYCVSNCSQSPCTGDCWNHSEYTVTKPRRGFCPGSCGYYGFYEPMPDLKSMYQLYVYEAAPLLVARVSALGRAVKHDYGFRSKSLRLEELIVFDRQWLSATTEIGRRIAIPVRYCSMQEVFHG